MCVDVNQTGVSSFFFWYRAKRRCTRHSSEGTRSKGTMRVHVHTKFCFLCVLTFLFNQCNHCHGDGHNHQHGGHHHADHTHSDLQISEDPYVRAATSSPDPKSPQGQTLEEEQRFYIQQLFRRYGQKDRLDFQGFQSLLFSLGLGEVKVVDVDHEELGHDHVAHLDLVDMQEGLHSHSTANEEHSQGHGHRHGHPHHKPGSHHPHTEVPTKCTQHTTSASPAAGAPTGHDHEHDAEHNHDPAKDGNHKHSDGHLQDTHDHDHDHGHDHAHDKEHKHEQVRVNSNQKDPPSQPHSAHDHSDHDHSDHDHSAHDHSTHDHSTHDHSDHDHSDHDHGHSDHDHGDHDHSEHDHGHSDHGHDHSDHGHDHSDHDHIDDGHSDHNHSDHHDLDHNHVPKVQTVTDIPPSPQLDPSQVPQSSPTTTVKPKKPKKSARVRGQRGRNRTPSSPPPSGDHDHQSEHSHDRDHGHSLSHKDKREAPGGHATPPTLPVPVLSGHLEGLSHQHEECLNLTQLLTYYGLSPDSLISQSQFTYLCPALLYQIDSRVCIRHYHQMDVQQEALEPVSSAWVWLWGFVSITIISLLSLLGVVLVPILKQSCFKFLLTFLVALAVGTLSGDALLHLLPHAQGQHDHGEHGTSEETDMATKFDGVWKGLTALAGIYLLFIIEHCIGMFKHYKDHRGMKKANEDGKIGRKLSDHKLNRRSDAEWLHLKPLTEDPDSTAVSCDNGHNDTQLSELRPPDSPTNKTPLAPADPQPDQPSHTKENGRKVKHHGHSHGHSHGGNCHSDQEMKDAGIASIAWMVIMGDGMHNFSDGLAIGAAFSANLTGGISTSVAVFCHELPHELGDFAVLLKAGMSVKQAIFYNLLSALMAYVGMVIGTAVGQYTHSVTSWIFAITAGMFLYVALVDMLPEMLHGDSEDHKRCQLGHFVLQNMGLLTGFGIMLLIAIFEDRIVFNFGF
ncbi:zinc transporter ZIP10 isoform X2 [Anoplopoma fimbria]|uniref:zinc transporter ZIP10 isoform X2 n=1 Tax=Anoplopoma fimbria TaxID=229290 RepID=UPI0023ECBFD4|nr:zinc transporter ZIP10 isoform X2 [Anoplopoma fimbria]